MASKNVRVSISGIKEISESTKSIINLAIADEQHLKELAEVFKKSVVGSARTGKDPDGKKFKPLSKSWIARKKVLATVNQPSEFYSKNRSNITFTGQLLNSFKYKINKAEVAITFFFEGMRVPYRGVLKPELDGIKTNKELAAKIEEVRPFAFLGEKTRDILINLIRRKIRTQLNNFKRVSKILR